MHEIQHEKLLAFEAIHARVSEFMPYSLLPSQAPPSVSVLHAKKLGMALAPIFMEQLIIVSIK